MCEVFRTQVDAVCSLAQKGKKVKFEFELTGVVADVGPVDVVELQILQVGICADMKAKWEVGVGSGVRDGIYFSFDIHKDIARAPTPMHRAGIANIERALVRERTRVEVVETAVYA